MASRSDSGNETRGSSESDNSPTPTKDFQNRSRFTPTKQQRSHPPSANVTPTPRTQINTRTTPISRTTPTTRPIPTSFYKSATHRLTPTTPTTSQRVPVRPLQRRPPSSGMGSAGSVHVAPLGPLGPLSSTRGRQRNSVAVVDSRDHIYEELEMCRGPPKLAPVSGVLQQGKVVIRPIAFKPVLLTQGGQDRSVQSNVNGNPNCSVSNCPTIQGRPDPRYTSTPTLIRGPIQHYGSMGDLKSLGHSSSYSLDRRGVGPPTNIKNYYDTYQEKNNNNSKFNSYTKMHNNKNVHLNNKSITHIIHTPPNSSPANSSKSSPHHDSSTGGESVNNNSPPSYPLPPPRPPSHQSTCSNIEDQQRFFDNNMSYDVMPPYDSSMNPNSYSRPASGYDPNPLKFSTDLPRFESLRNLSSAEPHSGIMPHSRNHHRIGGSVSNLARLGHHSGSNLGLDRSLSVTGSNLDRSVSGSNLGLERTGGSSIRGSLSELRLDDHHQTPSPSDSGVAELEAMLKEKDSEISTLRETMDKNEQVIFKVYEEKEKTWERELKKIRDLYDSRLKAAQQKALKVEQSLTTQTYQLQQERRKVSAELEEVKRERESGSKQVEQLRKEVSSLRAQLEETEWGLCQKSGEISLLKTQLKDSQGDQTTRGHELLHLRAQVRQYQQEIERRRAEITSMHDLSSQLRRENGELRGQLDQSQQSLSQGQEKSQEVENTRLHLDTLKREKITDRKMFEDQKTRWVEEKGRVIRYQKQLHQNYLSILSRNRQLEDEVARLTGVPLPASQAPLPKLPSLNAQQNGPSSLVSSYSELRDNSSITSESRC